MIKLFLFLLYVFSLQSCIGQIRKVVIQVYNRSAKPIDSVIVQRQRFGIGLGSGKTVIIDRDVSNINLSGEGAFPLEVYQAGKRYFTHWGFHDGEIFKEKEDFYFYDHGLSFSDRLLEMPSTFTLYFSLCSDKSLDSIYSLNHSTLTVKETTPMRREITYDYALLQRQPIFLMRLAGKEYRKNLSSHDFENWNDAQGFLTFAKGQFDIIDSTCAKEFIVDVDIKTDDIPEVVSVLSAAITKSYNYEKPKMKRFVFNYEKLKQNPIFTIQVKGKTFSKDLSADLSNPHIGQHIFDFTSNGLKSIGE